MTIKLRFAPSPTGKLHLGNLRAAILNFLYAKKYNGEFILRIDDTDLIRSQQKFIDQIKDDLNWLGITWDYSFSQSSRIDNYNDAIKKLYTKGFLYKCYETKEELEIKRKIQLSQKKPPVYDRSALLLTESDHKKMSDLGVPYYWRFKLDQGVTSWNDMIHGEIKIDTASISDPIIQKSDGSFVYLMASVVDDIYANITHIIRGDDHIANTAIQIQILDALTDGKYKVNFAHYPLLQSIEGDEFSKRNNSMSIESFRNAFIEPMALNSLLAKIGTSDPIVPYFSIEELIKDFDIVKISKSRPKIDSREIYKLNQKILCLTSYNEVKSRIPESITETVWKVIRENINTVNDVKIWDEIINKETKYEIPAEDKEFLKTCYTTFTSYKDYDIWLENLKKISNRKKAALFHPIRIAITGLNNGPELKKLFQIIGDNKIKERLKYAANIIA